MTTTNHRPRCTRPGWTTEPSNSIRGITIARCNDCGAIELRTADPMEPSAPEGPHGRASDEGPSRRWSA